jgi:N-acetyl-anhydromuramyl-L-alanine amidase AmpD
MEMTPSEEQPKTTEPERAEDKELVLREREVVVKERELELKRQEASASAWRSPLVLSVLGVTLAAIGNAAVSYITAGQQRELEDRKSEQSRILEMLKTGNADKAAENLRFLVEAGLISDKTLIASLNQFQQQRKPGTGPSLPTPSGNSIAERLAQSDTRAQQQSATNNGFRFYVLNHVLYAADGKHVNVVEAAHKGARLVATRAIVLHNTAAPGGNTAQWLSETSRDSPTSVHLVISRDGAITQLVAFDVAANHVGVSEWKGFQSLNTSTIGIMFENRGRLTGNYGEWPLPADQIYLQREGTATKAWERYTARQLETARDVIKALGRAYPTIEAVLSHSEVARPHGRTSDPGPAFDIAPMTAALEEGRRQAPHNGASDTPAASSP